MELLYWVRFLSCLSYFSGKRSWVLVHFFARVVALFGFSSVFLARLFFDAMRSHLPRQAEHFIDQDGVMTRNEDFSLSGTLYDRIAPLVSVKFVSHLMFSRFSVGPSGSRRGSW